MVTDIFFVGGGNVDPEVVCRYTPEAMAIRDGARRKRREASDLACLRGPEQDDDEMLRTVRKMRMFAQIRVRYTDLRHKESHVQRGRVIEKAADYVKVLYTSEEGHQYEETIPLGEDLSKRFKLTHIERFDSN